jgi:hypothetical protein
MHAHIRKLLLAAAVIVVAPPAFADVITDWNENAVTLVTPRMAPGTAQRVVAIMQVAMFDAVNSIERRYQPYLAQLPAASGTSKEAAATAAAAAGAVLASLIPQVQGQVKAMTTSYLASIADSDAKAEGIKLGETVAAKILEARAKDGADAPDSYRYKTKPIAIPAGSASRTQQRPMGHRLQRDQGYRRQDQHQTVGSADRGRPLLAHHRPAEHGTSGPTGGGGKEDERD